MKSSLIAALMLLVTLTALTPPPSAGAEGASPGDQLTLAVQQRALRVGDRGEQVAELQRLLTGKGFDPGPVDGLFGPRTEGAVRTAQAQFGLTEDGLAGRMTVGALRQEEGTSTTGLVVYQAGLGQDQVGPALAQAEPARVQAESARAQTEPTPAQAEPAKAPTEMVALTFNGLPEEKALVGLLTALADRHMKATFFVSGRQAEAYPDLIGQIHRAGHEIGNLGYDAIDMRRVSPITAKALIRRTGNAIAAATGQRAHHFRPPLGRFDRQLTTLVEEEGMSLVLWSNVAVLPAPEVEPARLAEQMSSTLFPHTVLMLPLDKPNAVAAVAPLLEQMEASGYRSTGLSELLGPS